MSKPEQFITEAASGVRPFSLSDFEQAMAGRELYFNFQEKVVDGVVSRVTPLGRLPSGFMGVVFFTSHDNANLQRPYAGMPFDAAMQMAVSVAGSDGVIIENQAGDWISIARSDTVVH